MSTIQPYALPELPPGDVLSPAELDAIWTAYMAGFRNEPRPEDIRLDVVKRSWELGMFDGGYSLTTRQKRQPPPKRQPVRNKRRRT